MRLREMRRRGRVGRALPRGPPPTHGTPLYGAGPCGGEAARTSVMTVRGGAARRVLAARAVGERHAFVQVPGPGGVPNGTVPGDADHPGVAGVSALLGGPLGPRPSVFGYLPGVSRHGRAAFSGPHSGQEKRGARRSAKAATPSASSPDAIVRRYHRAASASPSRPPASAATTSLVARWLSAEREARTSASRSTSAARSAAGTIRSTNPVRSAASASISSPLKSRYLAVAGPTSCISAEVDAGV